ELTESDACRIPVPGHAEVDQVAVREVRAGQDARHPSVHGVEAVRVAEEVVGGLRAAADARELGDPVRQDIELPERLYQCGGYGVVTAAGAERRDLAFVVPPGEPGLVLRQGRVMEPGLGEIGHAALGLSALTIGRTFSA